MSLARNLVALIEVRRTSIVADLILTRILVKRGCRFTVFFIVFGNLTRLKMTKCAESLTRNLVKLIMV